MYALNVTVKLLATLIKTVISPALSEISPEASANTAKPTKFYIKQMENRKILWIVKTSSTFSAQMSQKLVKFCCFMI